nr:MAG TPA_asm: hypothetical protein [Caudoviricetes sp.]
MAGKTSQGILVILTATSSQEFSATVILESDASLILSFSSRQAMHKVIFYVLTLR